MTMNVFYRVRPLKAPIRYCRFESYPDEASALKRAQEIVYACNLSQDPVRIQVDRVERNTGSLFIRTIADIQSDTYGRS